MDYHFVTPKVSETSDNSGIDLNRLTKLVKQFVPLFLMAAMLPVFIALVISPPQVGFLTRADTDPVLRIWLEPAQLITSPQGTVEMTVYAQFDSESKLIPELFATLEPDEGLEIFPKEIHYPKPFQGKVTLGTITVTPANSGYIRVPESQVRITAYPDNLEIKTSSAKIIAQ